MPLQYSELFTDLDHGQGIGNRVQAGTTVFLGHLDAHQAELAHLADVLQRKGARSIEFGGDRSNAFLREIAGDGLDRELIVAETEIHGYSLSRNPTF